MDILTLSPNCDINGARRVPHDGSGSSRVPRRASVRIESSRLGLASRASLSVSINSCSVFPMYSVDKYILLCAPRILAYTMP